MSRKVLVEVTAEDIERGEPGDACSCAIARAAERAGFYRPTFWPVSCAMVYGELRSRVELPPECGVFGVQFDRHIPVAPFSFEVEIPS